LENGNIKKLKELIDIFEHNIKQYKGKHYDELHGLTKEEIKIVEWGFAGVRGSMPNNINL